MATRIRNNRNMTARKPILLAAAAALMALSSVAFGGMSPRTDGVWLTDAANRPVVFVGPVKFNFAGNAKANVTGVSTNADGSLALAFSVAGHPEVSLAATLRETGGKFTLDYMLSGATNFNSGGVQGSLRLAKGMGKTGYPEKHGIWNRCAANPTEGEPFETYNVKLKRLGDANGALWYVLGGDENWSGGHSEHFLFENTTNGTCRCRVTLYAARPDEEGFEVAARHAGRPLAVRLWTEKRNNLFEEGSPELRYAVANVTGEAITNLSFAIDAWNWDGSNVLSRTFTCSLGPGERKEGRVVVPVSGRGLWFCEARAAQKEGEEAFTRTNVAILPPHEFRHRDKSAFGIIPSWRGFRGQEEAELSLMERMGVRWIRYGTNTPQRRSHGFESIALIDFDLKRAFDPGKSNDVRRVAACVARLKKDGIVYAEMGNEIGHCGNDASRRALFSKFETWLDAYRAERERQGADFKIIYGTSSFRPDLMRIMDDYHAWDKLDEYVIHPGRGYRTADSDGGGWRYLGLIRGTRRILEKDLGVKNPKFHLTEVYVKTLPNNPWADSYRQAAENMVLNAALAMEEGVNTFCVHKLHEGISWDDNGINDKNMEYHYGLLHRDNSPKPSFMGYVTAAEELDGATFRQWIFKNEKKDKLRGLIYDTPRGPLALLWDRVEGELLVNHAPKPRAKKAPFFHYEPWLDHWRVKKPRTFKAASGSVTVVDCIGRRRTVPTANGQVTLLLDGGPRFVYGLDLSEFTDTSRHEREHKASDIEEIDRQNRE